jgi:hypothetical protein
MTSFFLNTGSDDMFAVSGGVFVWDGVLMLGVADIG